MRTGRRRPRGAVILFRTLIAVLIAVLFSSATVSGADARAKSAALVIDANTGRVLHEQNADAIRYPASLTKMMTLFMVFEAIEQKRMSYKTIIRATKAATRKPPSKIGLKVGDKLTVRQAVAALVTKSANDVAAAVAIHLAGSEAAFARQMTRRARQIGMRNTRFRNASGLTDRLQRTTARDMIVLALRLQDDYPTHFRNFRLRSFTWRGRRFGNHNTLLRSFYGTTGIKTGYTRASGFNLVSSVKRGRKHVVAAVFGGRTSRARNAKMRILLARALKRASTRKTRKGRPLLVAQPRPVARPASLSLASIRPKPKSVRRQARQQTRRPTARPVTRQLARKTTRAPAAPARARTARPADARAVARTPQIAVARTRRVLFRDPTTRARQPQPRAVPSSRARIRAGIRAGMAPTSITDLIRQAAAPIRSPSSAGASGQDAGRAVRVASRQAVARSPSSLQEQAAALERLARGLPLTSAAPVGVPAPRLIRARVPGQSREAARQPVRTAATAPAASGPAIQVGSYRTEAEAFGRLRDVQRTHGPVLAGTAPTTQRIVLKGRQYYRARFVGLGVRAARSACADLTSRGVSCIVLR